MSNHPLELPDVASSAPLRRVHWRPAARSWLTSCGLHLTAVVALVMWEWRSLRIELAPELAATESRLPGDAANETTAWQQPPLPAEDPVSLAAPPVEQPAPKAFLSGEGVQQRLDEALAAVRDTPADQKLEQLEQAGARLAALSNAENVNRMSEWVLPALRLQPRRQVAADKKPFDPLSAQIDDVRLVRDESGAEWYLVVLVDAEGHRREDLFNDPQAAELHRLFRLLDRMPLLRSVYQSLAMAIMDRMVREAEAAEAAEAQAARGE